MSSTAVILDTNVFGSAGFNPGSASAEIIKQIRAGRLQMVWNDATRREIERILRKIPPLSGMEIADLFRDEDRHEGDTHAEQFTHATDPDDRKFAALSEATGAALITSDDHLLSARGQARAPIQTPESFGSGSSETRRREAMLVQGPRLIARAGKVNGCINSHTTAEGNDYIFAND